MIWGVERTVWHHLFSFQLINMMLHGIRIMMMNGIVMVESSPSVLLMRMWIALQLTQQLSKHVIIMESSDHGQDVGRICLLEICLLENGLEIYLTGFDPP